MKFFLFVLSFSILTAFQATAGYVTVDGKRVEVVERGEQTYKLIPLKSMSFSVIEKICKPWTSDNGVLTYEKSRNSVIIYDYLDVITRVEKFIKDLDRDRVNIRIEIDFDNKITTNVFDIKHPKIGDGKIVYDDGKFSIPGEISMELPYYSDMESSRNVNQMLVTLSGVPATLLVGKSVVDPTWFNSLIGRRTVEYEDGDVVIINEGVDRDIAFVHVGSSLMIRPNQLENGMIEVEIYPEVSYLNKSGGQEHIEVEKIKTTLVVRPGSRINIGGVVNSKLETYKQLFGNSLYKKSDGNNVLNMFLRATVLNHNY